MAAMTTVPVVSEVRSSLFFPPFFCTVRLFYNNLIFIVIIIVVVFFSLNGNVTKSKPLRREQIEKKNSAFLAYLESDNVEQIDKSYSKA